MNIYENKATFKFLIVGVALLVGFISIYYSQHLVSKLAQREKKLIDLYAKGLEYAVNSESSAGLTFIFKEILDSNSTIPVILADSDGLPLNSVNVEIPRGFSEEEKTAFLKQEIVEMKSMYDPIVIDYKDLGIKNYIYYQNSYFLHQLKLYPYIQLGVIGALALIAYLAFSYSRSAEQNRVWVGLAKETAHQLGTPLSSLTAWVELLRMKPDCEEIVSELEKDVKRLETITSRFSNIGFAPTLMPMDVYEVVYASIQYLQSRTSNKVKLLIEKPTHILLSEINKPLFDWVIENLCKNGIDAMEGNGNISIRIVLINKLVCIDVSDEGKGIPRRKFNDVFKPGYTTKKHGWGLGLTLAKRIIEQYHRGQIVVLNSEQGKGTTFRISLPMYESL
ncbi:MAG: HAMP domain-containing histidine kinase [Cytophagaceae bacterium]|jgi:K+-sensing histidine kinase KdpD|nr:HAMP domain-containing histidine kinase [Cytophagaceae bacterium]